MKENKIKKKDVSEFWNRHPLGSYDRPVERNEDEFYRYLDIKKGAASKFSKKLQEYGKNRGKKVLELGCGPGWNAKNFALNGADISACDISINSVKLAVNWFKKLNIDGKFCVGDVEASPFKSNHFDFVLCDGVLHHTPGIENGIDEIYRTMNMDGKGLISVYYENILLRGFMFNVTKFFLWLLRVKFLGNKPIKLSMSKEEFGRLYDGPHNVLGKIYKKKEIVNLIERSGLKIKKTEIHFFPVLFLPGARFLPNWLQYVLDRLFGCMIYFQVIK